MKEFENIPGQNSIKGKGTLYLIPALIADSEPEVVIPAYNLRVITGLRLFYVENIRTARRFISRLKLNIDISSLQFELLDQNTGMNSIKEMTGRLIRGCDAGILSEAGNPGIADPGSRLVAQAHAAGLRIMPLVGPSSILLALISSGFNGQNFAFNGYLPIQEEERRRRIIEIEKRMYKEDQTQVFIETPYRNNSLIRCLLDTLKAGTLLAIAADLSGPGQFIKMMPVYRWKKQTTDLNKIPAVFMLYREIG